MGDFEVGNRDRDRVRVSGWKEKIRKGTGGGLIVENERRVRTPEKTSETAIEKRVCWQDTDSWGGEVIVEIKLDTVIKAGRS